VSNKAPLVGQLGHGWLQAFRKITRATDERTTIVAGSGVSGFSDSTTLLRIDPVAAAASLLLANLDSIVLDWAARFSVGGVNMNFFIVKQLPVLPPQYFLERSPVGCTYAELLVPRVLELTYTADDLAPFARDLGYDGRRTPGTRAAGSSSAARSTPSSPTSTSSTAPTWNGSSTPSRRVNRSGG